jgi:hypothetical protein
MNLLPKDKNKRLQFILVLIGIAGVLAAIGFGLIRPQYRSLHNIALTNKNEQDNLAQIKNAIKKADDTVNMLEDVSFQLQQAEDDIASGDVNAWIYDRIRKFKNPYHVEIPSINQPTLSEVDMIPNYPYRQIKVNIGGTAYYHDLGKFVSDFENHFPHMRVVNLSMEPVNLPGVDPEKLAFQMDIIALVKPNS